MSVSYLSKFCDSSFGFGSVKKGAKKITAVTKCDLINTPASALTETSILYTDRYTDGHTDRQAEGQTG